MDSTQIDEAYYQNLESAIGDLPNVEDIAGLFAESGGYLDTAQLENAREILTDHYQAVGEMLKLPRIY